MEVHTHSHTARKKWTHYFWEFLMLFLAVFCGFLAEYQLEHKIEKNKEKQYIRSFVEDMEADTVSLNSRIRYCELTIKRADSAIAVLSQQDLDKVAGEIYYFLRWIHRSDVFNVNDKTIVQLRNAGGMRLVSSKAVSDSIINYYKDVDVIRFVYEEQTEFRRSLRPYFPKILDGIDYGNFINEKNSVVRTSLPVKLKISDPNAINACLLIINNIKGINISVGENMRRLKTKAKGIRGFLLREYQLK